MYKFLLCWRYLRTRFIALASIISVTLGVATMIVVNSVMEGFTEDMEKRIHGIHSDITFETPGMDGFPDPEAHMALINDVAGEYIKCMTPTVVVPAALCIDSYALESSITQPVQLIGIDINSQGEVSDFVDFLQHPQNRIKPTFELRDGGYDTESHLLGDDAEPRPGMERAGWEHRRYVADLKAFQRRMERQAYEEEALEYDYETPLTPDLEGRGQAPSNDDTNSIIPQIDMNAPGMAPQPSMDFGNPGGPTDPPVPMDIEEPNWMNHGEEGRPFDPYNEQFTGCIIGIGLVSQRQKVPDKETGKEHYEQWFSVLPGDDVTICIPTVGAPPTYRPGFEDDIFTVTDFYECRMAEFDSTLVFVPIERLQQLRGMIDGEGRRYVTQILINVEDGVDLNFVRDKIKEAFPSNTYRVSTWRDDQAIILQAVQMERAILNILLFLIIAVAGFGILAIFFMIVVEKTRDIGILKSLGASGWGVMQIFLSYGLALGTLGAGAGLILGLIFVHYINQIADLLSIAMGQEVFDPSIYYFYKIPTIVNPLTVLWIMVGAIGIAVGASVFPALRAARMHPVEALRHE
jgi:lipoprotein-releasing system permease protein